MWCFKVNEAVYPFVQCNFYEIIYANSSVQWVNASGCKIKFSCVWKFNQYTTDEIKEKPLQRNNLVNSKNT